MIMSSDTSKSMRENEYFSSTRSSREIWERLKKVTPSGVLRDYYYYDPYPRSYEHARGSRIYDLDGNECVDYCFNASSLILGHSHPKVISAIGSQLESGILSGIGPTEIDFKYAEKIVNASPCAEMIRFTPSGTEADNFAARLARTYTRKEKIAKFEGQIAGTGDFLYHSVWPPNVAGPESAPLSVPESEGIPKIAAEYAVILPFNDIDAVERIIKEHKDNLAAVIADPAMRGIPSKEGFFKALREITEENDVLLIFDEIVSGFRMTFGGGQEYFGVVPDIAIYGKIIGGGFPIGAFASSREIMSLIEKPKARVPHSGTFSAHPFSMAAGYATLCELNPQIYDHINRLGEEIRLGLSKIFEEGKIPVQVNGLASIFRIDFTDKEIVSGRDAAKANQGLYNLFRREMIFRGIFVPPPPFLNISTATTKQDIQLALDAAEDAITVMKTKIRV